MNRFFCILNFILLLFILLLFIPQPVLANNTPQEPIPLTLELLQQRVKSPINSDGIPTINLQNLMIDLTSENAEFRDNFYQLLQTTLNQPGKTIGLDLSNSLIKGEFIGSKLGLRAPLVGDSLSPLFTASELEQFQQDRVRISELRQFPIMMESSLVIPRQLTVFPGILKLEKARFTETINFTNTFFLNRIEATEIVVGNDVKFSGSRFRDLVNFTDGIVGDKVLFENSIFFDKARFNRLQFLGEVKFQNSRFEDVTNFHQSLFRKEANFKQVQWQDNVNFNECKFEDRGFFSKSRFAKSLFLTQAYFAKSVTFREAFVEKPVDLRGASIENSLDFSDATFATNAYLNVPELSFDSDQAKIIGDLGQIGQLISLPALQGNENLLRNLVKNFRLQEQVSDANQVEYLRAKLQLRDLQECLLSLTFSEKVDSQTRKVCPQKSAATYNLIGIGWQWLWLNLLLLLSGYGTSFWLIFGVGLIAIAYFGLLFWFVDRWRRRIPQPILPTVEETVWMLGSFAVFCVLGLTAILNTSTQPLLTIGCLVTVILPLPMIILGRIYWQGRYHKLMNVSYLTEDASMRQLRLMIGRLPIMPRFPFFRDRYMPILWESRWNWLNYYDFSLNNLLKFGFNDLRLRDEYMPGLISALVWYQWVLGMFYLVLLLWTLSRTIPGLNLLIYLK